MSNRLKIVLGILVFITGFLVIRVGSVLTSKVKLADTTASIAGAVSNNGDFTPVDPMTVDSDHDGLPDREEIIYGTDPNNPDTDGDGFTDGEEVAAGTDPLDPNDNIATRKAGTSTGSLSLVSPTANLTDRLLNTGLASLIDDSGNLNPDAMTDQKYADILNTINAAAAAGLAPTTIADSDIKIISDNSPAAITKYINTVSSIIEEGIFGPTGAMITGTSDDIIGLSQNENYYQNKYNALKVIEVPSSWKEIDKTTLTSLQSLANATKALTPDAINSDPVMASYALNQLQNAFLTLTDLISQACSLAQSQNVPIKDSIFDMLKAVNVSASPTPQISATPQVSPIP
jgi:hypothetical protein